MKSKFQTTSTISSDFSNETSIIKTTLIGNDNGIVKSEFQDIAKIRSETGNFIQFQLDNEYGHSLEVQVEGNNISIQLKSKNGQSLGGGSFNTGGGTSINKVVLDHQSKRLDFELANGNHFYCSLAELYNNKQDTLISGVNVKTIDGFSILGPGNINTNMTNIAVKDVQVNGVSIVTNKKAELTLGQGLSYNSNGLTLSAQNLTSIDPKSLSLEEQEGLQILIIDNDNVKKTSVNDLDFSKFTIQEHKDLSKVRVNDFLFNLEVE